MSFYRLLLSILLAIFLQMNCLHAERHYYLNIDINYPVIESVETDITVHAIDSAGNTVELSTVKTIRFDNKLFDISFTEGYAEFSYIFYESKDYKFEYEDQHLYTNVKPIPLWFSIIPPLIAILFALLFKEVFTALMLGIFSGTFMIFLYQGYNVFFSVFAGLFSILDTYVISALANDAHLSIIVFSMLIGGTVNLISKNGGMQGIIDYLSRYAKSSRSGQIVTWIMGICIFFDDYANTLVVGNTMRPVTDRLRVSREKLAYIVDSTAAPIAAVAFVTTWIGAELSYIQATIDSLEINTNAYSVFFSSLQYAFYPFLTLIFVFMVIWTRRDFGPMYKVELRSRMKGVTAVVDEKKLKRELKEDFKDFEISDEIKPKAYNAIIPVCVIVFGAIAGLVYTGWNQQVWNDNSIGFLTKLSITIGDSDSYKALIWSSFGGLVVAIVLSVVQEILDLHKCIESMLSGFKTMLTAILILTLAWTLSALISDLKTAEFITNAIQSTQVSPIYIPAITFIVSALVAFSTGSSWGTMAIMYPLILPATWILGFETGMTEPEALSFFAHVASTVIAGSVFGDHCSPISDTTILSSLASSCNHIQHVRTQLPYAISVGVVSLVIGTLPAALGLGMWLTLPLGIGVLALILFIFGKKLPITRQQT
jgi:Na+/H+ antiporter NhaC